MSLEYWYLFPTGILVASLAISGGVSGSNFWIPVYLIWMGLEPRVAFWVSLATMLFGFGSGVVRNLRSGTVDGRLIGLYLCSSVPAAVLGAALSRDLPVRLLLIAFASFVLVYGLHILWAERRAGAGAQPPKHEKIFHLRSGQAGFLQGAIATGSGAVLLPCLLDHRRITHPATSVGSTVVLVFVLSLVSVLFRVDATLLEALVASRWQIASMLVFAAPGVVIGGQIGPRIAERLSRRALRRYVALLLLVVGALVAVRAAVL
ncbi:MAG: sulfite exporter TauE/SafE family protein [Holophagales bacterium]|nr:sulfite exporter TauE/SafE family protein [Holophagales bacterium]